MNPGATLAYALSGHCGRSTRARPPVLSHLRSSHYDLLSAQEHSRAATYYSQRETRTQRVQCTFAASAAHPRTFAAMPHRCILGTRATVGLGQCAGYIVLTYPRPIEKEGTRCSPLFPDPHALRVHARRRARAPLPTRPTPRRVGLPPGAIAAAEAHARKSRVHIRALGCHPASRFPRRQRLEGGSMLLDFLHAIAQRSSGQSHRSRPAKILDRRPGFSLSSAAVCQGLKKSTEDKGVLG